MASCHFRYSCFSEYINISYRDRVEEESETADDLLLSIRKPEFEECPIPDELFADWLVSGWDDYHTEADVMPERNITSESPDTEELSEEDAAVEQFEDNSERVAAYQNWQVLRSTWVDRQHIIEKRESCLQICISSILSYSEKPKPKRSLWRTVCFVMRGTLISHIPC